MYLYGRGGWKELGGVEGGETVIRIYHMVKNLFAIKNNEGDNSK
mgnify:CR=1 FL=1